MRFHFWVAIFLAVVAVSCTHAHRETAQSRPQTPSTPIRCANTVDAQSPSDPCTAKTMAGQRPPGSVYRGKY
jgi:hypothetical protein